MSHRSPLVARLVPADGSEFPSQSVGLSGMVSGVPPVVKVIELSRKSCPSATWKIAFTCPPPYKIGVRTACHPVSSPGKASGLFESLPVKKARSRSLRGLPSLNTTTSEAPFALQPAQLDRPAIV